jgi:hypothetical protein
MKARIVPRRVRWPDARADPAFAAAHDCVHACENVVHDVESRCMAGEQKLAADAVRLLRVETRDRALALLLNFRPFATAEKALSPKASRAWLNRCRRLVKDWENLNCSDLAFLKLASIRLMLRKLCNP